MFAAARVTDNVNTGHLCTTIVPIVTTPQTQVFIGPEFLLAAVVGATLAEHTIKAGSSCVPHPGQIVNPKAGNVFIGPGFIPAARIGDSADLGAIITGSPLVFYGS